MSPTVLYALPSAIVAIAMAVIAVAVAFRQVPPQIRVSLSALCWATVVVQLGHVGILVLPDLLAECRQISFVGEAGQAAGLQLIGWSLLRSFGDHLPRRGVTWRVRGLALAVAFVTAASLAVPALDIEWARLVLGLGFGPLGRITLGVMLIALALGLAQLEEVLRGTRDPLRYRIKYILIGVGVFAGFGIYQTSQLLLLPQWRPELAIASGVTGLVAVPLIAFGLVRARLGDIGAQLRASSQMVFGSVTVVVVGLYLAGLGIVAEIVSRTGRPERFVLAVFIVSLGLVALTVLAFSRHVRIRLQRWLGRHLLASRHDYREKWREVTEAFRERPSVEAILDELVHLLGRAFQTGWIGIWMLISADRRYHRVRSLNVEPPPPPLDEQHPIIRALQRDDAVVDLQTVLPAGPAREAFIAATRAEVLVPIRTGDRLLGFVVLGPAGSGGYATDDADLLRAIAQHVGALVARAQLARESEAGAELRAIHQLAAFCIHDLKNLAGRLSLVVQNAANHGHDPEFQASAMRTVGSTVERMMALIAKLSTRTTTPATGVATGVASTPVDLSEVFAELDSAVKPPTVLRLPPRNAAPAYVALPQEQLSQILLNLVMNADQALAAGGRAGTIQIELLPAAEARGTHVVTVTDNGPGITPSVLATLFEPLRTTKAEGLGIGLFQCRAMAEAAGGRLTLASDPGRGATARLELPAAPPPEEPRRTGGTPSSSSSAPSSSSSPTSVSQGEQPPP